MASLECLCALNSRPGESGLGRLTFMKGQRHTSQGSCRSCGTWPSAQRKGFWRFALHVCLPASSSGHAWSSTSVPSCPQGIAGACTCMVRHGLSSCCHKKRERERERQIERESERILRDPGQLVVVGLEMQLRIQCCTTKWLFPQLGGPFCGSPHNENLTIWDPYSGFI